jgi:glycosyltransferase involved in cell wall biosynthesis
LSARQRTILTVAYPFAPVRPDSVGGAEQVLQLVESALVSRGFRSMVVAHADSIVAGELCGVEVPEGVVTPAVRTAVERGMQNMIDAAVRSNKIDLVHMHGVDFADYVLPKDLPVLVTLHLPPTWYPPEIWHLPQNYTLQCVSESQRGACPSKAQSRIIVVPNGVVLPSSAQTVQRENFALLLSRICPEKGLHIGMKAARTANMPVVLAGNVYPYSEHLEYFAREIEPLLGNDARFIGPAAVEAKHRLLQQARCLLVPSLVEETSSLVAMEAGMAGTPVIALRSGALRQIVEEGRTGFLVSDGAGMAAAIGRLGGIDAEVCRRTARERFSADDMIDRYVALYEKLIRCVQYAPLQKA